jgi:molecular chaperone DnaK
LAKDEVERMVKDAQSHAEDDRVKREETEARNRADNLIYSTEKTLRENRDKLSAADVETVEKGLEEARKAVEKGGREDIDKAVEELTRASHRLAEVLYQKASPGATPGEGPDGAGETPKRDGGDVIDAEVVDKS